MKASLLGLLALLTAAILSADESFVLISADKLPGFELNKRTAEAIPRMAPTSFAGPTRLTMIVRLDGNTVSIESHQGGVASKDNGTLIKRTGSFLYILILPQANSYGQVETLALYPEQKIAFYLRASEYYGIEPGYGKFLKTPEASAGVITMRLD